MSSWRSVHGLGCSSVVECLLIACKAKGLILGTPSPPCKGKSLFLRRWGCVGGRGTETAAQPMGKAYRVPAPF
jgi:hypothetical protein